MKLIDVHKQFQTDDQCLDYIEAMRWPKGEMACVHCGEVGNISKIERSAKKKGKNQRTRLYQCRSCGKQFSATSGTIFNDSHLPLTKWFLAIALICEAKKGISACQLQRHLGVNYRTAWFLAHRIREAMAEGGLLTGVVEADETYFGVRKRRKGRPFVKKQTTDAVLGMIKRGGELRLIPIPDAKMATIEPILKANIDPRATLQTDASAVYDIMRRRQVFAGHRMIDHIEKYAEGENHTNTIESAFSLLKRGMYGTFHRVSIKHLGRYCNEFSYRFNRRDAQRQMFNSTLKRLTSGKALPYKKLTASEESAF